MSGSFDYKTTQFAKLGLKKGIYYDTVSIDVCFMHFDQVLESVVYSLFESLNLILVHQFAFVKLHARLNSCNLVL